MSEAVTTWPILNALERRVLGVLVEKMKTTPDVYPMSINGLVTGCNQKSNRDPLMNVDEGQVEETLEGLQPKGLVMRVQSGRVDRWRHLLYEAWSASKVELAILAELLLRGPQTEGELRGRAGRMEPIGDLEELRTTLRPLVDRKLVVYLTPERSRGTMVTHGFHASEEITFLRGRHAGDVTAPDPPALFRPVTPAVREQAAPAAQGLSDALNEIKRLDQEIKQLWSKLDQLTTSIAFVQESLGIAAKPASTPSSE